MSRITLTRHAVAVAVLSLGFCAGAIAQTAATSPSGTSDKSATSASTKADAKAEAKLDRGERKFIEEAAAHGMAEVELGKLAMEKGSSDQVKNFGERMVEDHSKANEQVQQIASTHGIELPKEIDRQHRRELEKLQKLSGEEFDREYMKSMVDDHKKDVKDFKKMAEKAKDPQVKSFASSTAPKLEQHLQLAQTTMAAVQDKGDRRTAGSDKSGPSSTMSGAGTAAAGGSGSAKSGSDGAKEKDRKY